MTKRLEGKVALITGTGGRGQGQTAALRFTAEGARVVGCDLNAEGNQETVRKVRENGGEMVSIEPLDLSNPDSAEKLIKLTEETYGRLDILYNNAGAPRLTMFPEMTEEDWKFTIRNELDLIFYTVKAAVPLMIKSGGGSVINTASIAAIFGQPLIGTFAHAAAKAGVLGITRSMAYEMAPHNIRTNAIIPGAIANPEQKGLYEDTKIQELVSKQVLLRRFGTPEDIVNAALFLASDESSYITGISLVVDGGWTAW